VSGPSSYSPLEFGFFRRSAESEVVAQGLASSAPLLPTLPPIGEFSPLGRAIVGEAVRSSCAWTWPRPSPGDTGRRMCSSWFPAGLILTALYFVDLGFPARFAGPRNFSCGRTFSGIPAREACWFERRTAVGG